MCVLFLKYRAFIFTLTILCAAPSLITSSILSCSVIKTRVFASKNVLDI